jgi:hypothetical protein
MTFLKPRLTRSLGVLRCGPFIGFYLRESYFQFTKLKNKNFSNGYNSGTFWLTERDWLQSNNGTTDLLGWLDLNSALLN